MGKATEKKHKAVESELLKQIPKWDQIRPSWLTVGQLSDEEKSGWDDGDSDLLFLMQLA